MNILKVKGIEMVKFRKIKGKKKFKVFVLDEQIGTLEIYDDIWLFWNDYKSRGYEDCILDEISKKLKILNS